MRIQRVQKGSSSDAIGSSALKTRGVHRTGIATDRVVSTAARVIRIVDPELRVIKNVEGLSTELKLAGLPDLEMLQHRHVPVHATRIIQKVPACVSEREPSRSHKLRRIADERTKAARIIAGRRQSIHHVRVRG